MSDISNVISQISLKKEPRDRGPGLEISAKTLERYFLLNSQLSMDIHAFLTNFELVVKVICAFKNYYLLDSNKSFAEVQVEFFDFFLAVMVFEETNLLLNGAESTLFDRSFSLLSFYLGYSAEFHRETEETSQFLSHAMRLCTELSQSLK